MTIEEQNWVKTLKRLAAISDRTVPELLNSYWECETDCVNSIVPYAEKQMSEEVTA